MCGKRCLMRGAFGWTTTAAVVLLCQSCSKDPIGAGLDLALDGIFENADGMRIEADEDEIVVVDFGSSPLGGNPSVFAIGDAYVDNLVRSGPGTWNGDVAKGQFFGDHLNAITRVSTPIHLNAGQLTFGSDAPWKAASASAAAGPAGGLGSAQNPPDTKLCEEGSDTSGPQPESTVTLTSQGSTSYREVREVLSEWGHVDPFFRGKCEYRLTADVGSYGSLYVVMGHKPTTAIEPWTVDNGDLSPSPSGVSIRMSNGRAWPDRGSVTVKAGDRGGFVVAATNIELDVDGYSEPTILSFQITGQ